MDVLTGADALLIVYPPDVVLVASLLAQKCCYFCASRTALLKSLLFLNGEETT